MRTTHFKIKLRKSTLEVYEDYVSMHNGLAGFIQLYHKVFFCGTIISNFENDGVNSEGQDCLNTLLGNLCEFFTGSGLQTQDNQVIFFQIAFINSRFGAHHVCELTTFGGFYLFSVDG